MVAMVIQSLAAVQARVEALYNRPRRDQLTINNQNEQEGTINGILL